MVLKPLFDVPFLPCYLNDCICIPFLVPIMLGTMRRFGLRRIDSAPEPVEVFLPLVVWAAVFEVVLPNLQGFEGFATADPLDVLSYCCGATIAMLYWRIRYPQISSDPRSS